jgi:hypothetical protein
MSRTTVLLLNFLASLPSFGACNPAITLTADRPFEMEPEPTVRGRPGNFGMPYHSNQRLRRLQTHLSTARPKNAQWTPGHGKWATSCGHRCAEFSGILHQRSAIHCDQCRSSRAARRMRHTQLSRVHRRSHSIYNEVAGASGHGSAQRFWADFLDAALYRRNQPRADLRYYWILSASGILVPEAWIPLHQSGSMGLAGSYPAHRFDTANSAVNFWICSCFLLVR